jgi:predicted ArsR family transcriptional regulator
MGTERERTMIKLPPGIEVEDIPLEKRYTSNLRGLLVRIRKLYEAIEDRFGDEGLTLIREVSVEYGSEIAERVKEREGEMDIHDVALFLVKVFNGMRSEGEVTVWTDELVCIMVPECPYPFTRPQTCAAHTAMEEALVKGLNPGLDYRIEECIPKGDAECHHVLSTV